MLFQLENNNKYELEYPDLSMRKKIAKNAIIGLISLKYEYDLDGGFRFKSLLDYYCDAAHKLSGILLYNLGLYDFHSEKAFVKILKHTTTWNEFLYVFELILSVCKNNSFKIELATHFNNLNTDYRVDKRNYSIKKVLLNVDSKIIKHNIANLKNLKLDKKYQSCVDEFLKTNNVKDTSVFYHSSLNNIKRVFENLLTKLYSRKISEKRFVCDKLVGKTDDKIISNLEFIIKNIHHDETGDSYSFTHKEYIFWWFEINKMIYLLNI